MKSKLEKQKEAEARFKIRAKRSPKDQLDHLDSIFGKNQGASKERNRLIALMQNLNKAEVEEKPKKRKKKDR